MAFPLRLARLERTAPAGGREPAATELPPPFRLRTPADVVELLERQIVDVAADPTAGVVARARAIGYLAALSLKAIEVGNLAARLEGLEAALKLRDNRSGTP